MKQIMITKETSMINSIKITGIYLLASLLLSGGVAIAADDYDTNEKAKNMTLKERLYLFDGYGAAWGLDVGNDGLWFVPEQPIGDTYGAPFKIRNGATDNALVIGTQNNGNVGFGTDDPSEAVDVVGTDAAARFKLTSITNTGNQAAQYVQQRARSDSGSPAAVESGDVIGMFSFRGWHGSGWTGTKAGITVTATEDWSTSSNGNLVTISHTPNGSSKLTPALQIKGNADVYIPNGNLYVKGEKMSVPDYVFKDDYKLMPLEELKTFIKKNNHLPGVASADEVGKAGVVNLSGLQMTLLEKVEELTLYTLQQEAKIAKQEAKIARLEAMQKRLTQVESLLTNLALDTSGSNQEKVSMK
ncbi:MAG: hypothetical protein U9Q90_06795 [Campylobacterota bacterium]|nr:hypothetical protein [Campylobacterota bacterium]